MLTDNNKQFHSNNATTFCSQGNRFFAGGTSRNFTLQKKPLTFKCTSGTRSFKIFLQLYPLTVPSQTPAWPSATQRLYIPSLPCLNIVFRFKKTLIALLKSTYLALFSTMYSVGIWTGKRNCCLQAGQVIDSGIALEVQSIGTGNGQLNISWDWSGVYYYLSPNIKSEKGNKIVDHITAINRQGRALTQAPLTGS